VAKEEAREVVNIIDTVPLVDDAGEKVFVQATPDVVTPPAPYRRPCGGLFNPCIPLPTREEMAAMIAEMRARMADLNRYYDPLFRAGPSFHPDAFTMVWPPISEREPMFDLHGELTPAAQKVIDAAKKK